jgi:hypothetical protein
MLICKVMVETQVNLSLYPSLPKGPLCGGERGWGIEVEDVFCKVIVETHVNLSLYLSRRDHYVARGT